jgi:hypothetical protein
MSSYHLKRCTVLLGFTLLLTGCAGSSIREADPLVTSIESFEPKEKVVKKTSDSVPTGCGWRNVAYRGRVLDQETGKPVKGACVKVCEGAETVTEMQTGADGNFELACSVYGANLKDEKGRTNWKPENYYMLVVERPDGSRAMRQLCHWSPGKQEQITLGDNS